MLKYLKFIIIFLIILWLTISIFNQWRAEIYSYQTRTLNNSNPQSLNYYNTSISLSPSKSENHFRLAKFYEDRASKEDLPVKERLKWLEKERNELIKAIELEPTNAIYHLTLGWVYYYLFVYDNKIEYEKTAEKEFRLAYRLDSTSRSIEAIVIKYLTRLKSSITQ